MFSWCCSMTISLLWDVWFLALTNSMMSLETVFFGRSPKPSMAPVWCSVFPWSLVFVICHCRRNQSLKKGCRSAQFPVKNSISQRCHGEIMIYSQLPHTITSLQHHFEAAHLIHHDMSWWGHTCEFPVSSLWVGWDVADSTGLLVVSSGYYWGLRWLFVVCVITGVCHISANLQGTGRELTSVTSPTYIMIS